jgi:D-alanyl-D-alanine carboxypeptidase/D-alanyl-D-alanine-endopeptidase (penicillin-binding protein 4)
MAAPMYAHARWGLLETDPSSGRSLQSLQPDQLFVPGSTTKLFPISAAWKILGPESRITTPVYATGPISGGRLEGNLVLVGKGDLDLGGRTKPDGTIDYTNDDHADANSVPGATLTAEDPLAGIISLARQVRGAGVTDVAGDVLVDDRLFVASSNLNPAPTPIILNDNLVDLQVTPTAPGSPASGFWRPQTARNSVTFSVTTGPAGSPVNLSVSGPDQAGHISVSGQIPAGGGPQLRTADITDPAAFARTAFIEALQREGVSVHGSPVGPNPAGSLPPSASLTGQPIASLISAVYSQYARLILKVSLNLGANLAVCLLAAHGGQTDCNAGFPAMAGFARSAGVDVDQVAIADGRGGFEGDRFTPRAVVMLLTWWTKQPDFDTFRQTLPILGVDGSLTGVQADSPARGKVSAKTGTAVSFSLFGPQPRFLLEDKALAGYLDEGGGRYLPFDLVVNDVLLPDTSFAGILRVLYDTGKIAAILQQAG